MKYFIQIVSVILAFSQLIWGKGFSQQNSKTTHVNTIRLQRVNEPRENAFSILIPTGWKVDGGIVRVDPLAQGGPAQSIAAKLDFSVKKDTRGTVMIRWLPDVLFFDPRYSPAGQMGLLPVGSNYMGMTVSPLLPADQFLTEIAFPYAHPGVPHKQVADIYALPKVAQAYHQQMRSLMPDLGFSYEAAIAVFSYQEGGVKYKEKMVAIIENMGQLGAGMWANKETYLIRAPENEYQQWEAVISLIQKSVQINPQWMLGEIKGQMERGGILIRTQQEMQRIGQEMLNHRQRTQAEIQNDMYLNLTDQEEYVNPFTNKVEVGSNQWNYRWINQNGDVIYTNDESYQPNSDPVLHVSGFKRTPIRKRFPNE